MAQPIVLVSSYPPRPCGIATFVEEAREFLQRAAPEREVLVIAHTDGEGEGVFPLMDLSRRNWWKPVADQIEALNPYVVHLQHEYGLYEYRDERGVGDGNQGFLALLDAIASFPIVVEPHTVHGRLRDFEANFLYHLCRRCDVVLLKCHYQKWRLDWTFPAYGWEPPRNLMVVPHGARPDRRWGVHEIPRLRRELGVHEKLSPHVVGMVGWIQANKRWDILLSMWEEIHGEIRRRTGQQWDLLAAGTMRDPQHRPQYEQWKAEALRLEEKGIAHYYEFVPRGEQYYKVMAICDFIALPTVDETQSGTLARIIALNKPYVTTAPLEGLTAQTLESGGGVLFTNKRMLREQVLRLATDEALRLRLGENLRRYLEEVVSWEVVVRQYLEAYELAARAKATGRPVELPPEF